METIEIGVLGGCGLYQVPEITDTTRYSITTPFGAPSGDVVVGTLRGKRVGFIPRHGEKHTLAPSDVPYRANIYAFKQMGVKFIISVNACGSLREDYRPGDFVLPDQIYDQTKNYRGRTFFEEGLVAHTSTATPFCEDLGDTLADAAVRAGATVHRSATFVTIEGPRFSSRAESQIFRQLGCSIVGMTSSPEAFLAREAEISYASLAYVTDYDSWRSEAEAVTVCGLENTMQRSAEIAQLAVAHAVELLDTTGGCTCHTALDDAILTDPTDIPSALLAKLHPILQRRFALA